MQINHINQWHNRPGLFARPDLITQTIRRARLLGGLPHTGGALPTTSIVIIDLVKDEDTARRGTADGQHEQQGDTRHDTPQ